MKNYADTIIKNYKKKLNCVQYNMNTTVHCLRHTYGSYLLSKGTPVFSVSRLLGHASVQTTERVYAHLLQSGSQEAIKPLEAFDFNETYDFEEDVEDFYEED